MTSEDRRRNNNHFMCSERDEMSSCKSVYVMEEQ